MRKPDARHRREPTRERSGRKAASDTRITCDGLIRRQESTPHNTIYDEDWHARPTSAVQPRSQVVMSRTLSRMHMLLIAASDDPDASGTPLMLRRD
jgi:hypothetical protein